jgi:hypothetical protein
MSRFRQIHNLWSVGIGPSPCTGYHYSNYQGEKHNNPNLTKFDSNLIKPLNRIQSFSYDFNVGRENLMQLGQSQLVRRFNLNQPTIDLSLSYYLDGVGNERNIGLDVNYTDFSGVYVENESVVEVYSPKYNSNQFLFTNFTGDNNDSKNLFVTISPDSEDINNRILDSSTSGVIHPKDCQVIGFGNCYLNSYSFGYSVGAIPMASVGFVADNMLIHSSGSGVNIPAIHPKSGNLMPNVYFTCPRSQTLKDPTVLSSSELTLTFDNATGDLFGIFDNGIPIRSFNVSIDIPRDELKSIGYRGTINRKALWPIFAQISCEAILSGYNEDSLNHILSSNTGYNISLSCYNQCGTETQIQYNIIGAKFEGMGESRNIGGSLATSFGYSVEIDPYISNGIFISGKLNNQYEPMIQCLLLGPNKTGFLFLENNNLLLV